MERVRVFFAARGFLEVDTPVLVPSPGLDLHLDAFETNGPPALRYLSTSPEYQMKRLLAEGYPRLVQITRAFRRNEHGQRHNCEFTMLEFYRAPGTVHEVMADTEQLLASLSGGEVQLAGRTLNTLPPYPRLPVRDAFMHYAHVEEREMLRLAREDETKFYELLAFTIEPALALRAQPVFLTEYPIEQASLARALPADARYAERFELYAAGIELCNGFGELVVASEQRMRLLADQAARSAAAKPVYPIDERFLGALQSGIPAAAGNAIGLDRMMALALGLEVIAPVVAFTQDEL
jgi:elongation factor P--(R)-beta-lysine ligase